jgi:peptidyl-prolyl cis-trans isomerase A (cyclophilin A)
MRHIFAFLLSLFLLAFAFPASADAQGANKPAPGIVRVRLVTSEGPIVIGLETRRAPKTSANFLTYVDDGRFDDTQFYRAARRKTDPKLGFIQGGVGTDARRTLPAIPHEPTTLTGIQHLDATISMARNAPGSAMGNFFLTVGSTPNMDAAGQYAGYAAFGHVVAGMDTVRRILAMPTGGGEGAMRGQKLLKPVRLIRAERIDGKARPSSPIKPWLMKTLRKDMKPRNRSQ